MADGVVWELADAVLEDASGNVIDDCPDCPCDEDGIETDCNPERVPESLTLVITFICVQFSVTLNYNPDIPGLGGAGWFYDKNENDQIPICDDFEFVDLVLWCDGDEWSAEFAYTEDSILFSVTTGSGLSSITTVSTDPLCLTLSWDGVTFECGTGDVLFAIGSGCDVIPTCCTAAELPSTATLTYTLGALAPVEDSLVEITGGYGGIGTNQCDVGDGTILQFSFSVVCGVGSDCDWGISFNMVHVDLDPFVILKSISWQLQNIKPGTVPGNPAISCSPFTMQFETLNTSGPASASTVTCDGIAYPFGPAGTINGVFSVVTP